MKTVAHRVDNIHRTVPPMGRIDVGTSSPNPTLKPSAAEHVLLARLRLGTELLCAEASLLCPRVCAGNCLPFWVAGVWFRVCLRHGVWCRVCLGAGSALYG